MCPDEDHSIVVEAPKMKILMNLFLVGIE